MWKIMALLGFVSLAITATVLTAGAVIGAKGVVGLLSDRLQPLAISSRPTSGTGVSRSPSAILRIRSDIRESRLTIPLPTHNQAARVAAMTLITLITVNSVRPSSKLLTASVKDSED